MRILIVEDEFKIADVIASRLRNEQYIVDVYGDGEEGLDNALTNIYDLIILDVMLPRIDGFKILQKIRKQKIESKVIMLTAKSMLEDKLTGFDAGSNVHRIGNLTLTKPVYNSEMRDYSFKKKLAVSGGIKDSHFILSNWILDYVDNYEKENQKDAEWNIQQINDRSNYLADLALKIWEYPNLSEEEIKPYKFSNKYEKVSYENIDHLPEMKEKIQKVFDRFDKDIMELDDRITKVITKHYIAYKYDYSNFAEIIVYKNSLNILLDLPIELLKDDKNIAESITVGSWGTGNIRIKVWDDSDYDYKIDLIRQSLENEKNIN